MEWPWLLFLWAVLSGSPSISLATNSGLLFVFWAIASCRLRWRLRPVSSLWASSKNDVLRVMWQWYLCALCSTSWQHPFLEQLCILGLTSFSTAEQPGKPTGFYRQIKGGEQFTGLCPIKYKNRQPLANISVCHPSPFNTTPPIFRRGNHRDPLALGSCKRETTCRRQKAGNETMSS